MKGKSRVGEVVGWEQWGGEALLRVKLREPYEAAVWPGSGGTGPEPPPAEMRTLSDRMFTLKELFRAVSDQSYADDEGFGAGDVQRFKEALREKNGKGGRGTTHFRPSVHLIAPGM